MEVTYMLIVSVVTYILGAINRAFFETLPNRFFPIQNVVIGLISGFVCYFANIAISIATNYKTLYILGCFGVPLIIVIKE